MALLSNARLLRIYFDEEDKHEGRPLYEAIVYEAHRCGLAGATVLRGTLGFGIKHHIHSAKILEISQNLPMVVEIVDSEEKIAAFMPKVQTMIREGIATVEKVNAIVYPINGPAESGSPS